MRRSPYTPHNADEHTVVLYWGLTVFDFIQKEDLYIQYQQISYTFIKHEISRTTGNR